MFIHRLNRFYAILLLLTTSCQEQLKDEITLEIRNGDYCYDGDTCYTNDYNSIRIEDIDTPEIKGKCNIEIKKALEAKEYINSILKKAKDIRIKINSKDRYGRYLGTIYVDGTNIKLLLLDNTHTRYYGNRNWCN